MTQIIVERPPNYGEICARFPDAAKRRGVIFAWGDVIYNPDGIVVTPDLVVHERLHGIRQTEMGIEAWWARYLADREFMVLEEVLAHQAEYAYMVSQGNRNQRRLALKAIAGRLSGPLYGRPMSTEAAKKLLKDGLERPKGA